MPLYFTLLSSLAQLKASILKIFSSDEVREIEAALVEKGFSTDELMQSAGEALYKAAKTTWPSTKCWLVLCGSGNNGGDGFAAARLANKSGINVCCAVAKKEGLPREAQHQYTKACDEGVKFVALDELTAEYFDFADLIVDALLGIGYSGAPLRDPIGRVIKWANRSSAPIISADVPSGLDASRGGYGGIEASLTISFIACKRGLVTGCGKVFVGELQCSMTELLEQIELPNSSIQLLTASEVVRPYRNLDAHKANQGTVNVIGGVEGMGGAAIMAAEAASQMGAGRTLCTTSAATIAAGLSRSPEIMYRTHQGSGPIPTVTVVGPGMGRTGVESEAMWNAAIQTKAPAVIDADALYWLKTARANPLANNCVITPHAGEAAHLLDCTVDEVERDRYAAAAELAHRYSAVALLKGPGTIVHCNASKQVVVVGAGTPALAVGGSGDTLAGTVGALIAQGYNLFEAASQAALMHAVAAERWVECNGVIGLRPSTLLAEMIKVINGR